MTFTWIGRLDHQQRSFHKGVGKKIDLRRSSRRFNLVFVFSFMHMFCQMAHAYDSRWTHYGLRPLAMGNAFVAVADDYNALFYNPAGLANHEGFSGKFLFFTFAASDGLIKAGQDLQKSTKIAANSNDELLNLIENNLNENFYLRLGATPHFMLHHFGMGLGADLYTEIEVSRYPTLDVDMGLDMILPIAYSWHFFEDRLKFGFGLKFRSKAVVQSLFSIQDLEAFSKKDNSNPEAVKLDDYVRAGYGFGTDLGFLFTPSPYLEPTLGISVTDFGGTSFRKSNNIGRVSLGEPVAIQPSVNAGVSLKPLKSDNYYVLLASDIHSLNHNKSFSKKVHFGTEFGFKNLLKAQLGLYHGYYTAGVQVDLWLLELGFATYTEEMGRDTGSNPSRRYIANAKLLF